jgi:DNA polymerase III gamma/tau subunit
VPGLPPKDLAKQASQFDAAVLAQDIAILEELRRQVRHSQAGRALLDATLVRMTMAGQFASVASLLNRLDGAPAAAGQKKKFEPVISDFKSEISDSASPHPNPPPEYREREPEDDGDGLPAVGKVWEDETPRKSYSTIMAEARRSQPRVDKPVPSADPSDPDSVWKAVKEVLSSNQVISSIIGQGNYGGVEDGLAVIRFAKAQDTFVKMLDRNGKRELVIDAFTRVLNQPTGVRFEIDESLAEPVAAKPVNAAPRPVASRSIGEVAAPPTPVPSIRLTPELRAEIEADPLVRAIMETLGGTVVRVE